MIVLASWANVCAYVLRWTVDLGEVGSRSLGCGIKARMADIARLNGVRGRYTIKGSDDGLEQGTGYCNGRSRHGGDALGGRIGKYVWMKS